MQFSGRAGSSGVSSHHGSGAGPGVHRLLPDGQRFLPDAPPAGHRAVWHRLDGCAAAVLCSIVTVRLLCSVNWLVRHCLAALFSLRLMYLIAWNVRHGLHDTVLFAHRSMSPLQHDCRQVQPGAAAGAAHEHPQRPANGPGLLHSARRGGGAAARGAAVGPPGAAGRSPHWGVSPREPTHIPRHRGRFEKGEACCLSMPGIFRVSR